MQNSQWIPTTVKEAPESFSLAQQVPLEETSHESLGAGLAVFGLVLVLKRGPYEKNRTGTYPKMKMTVSFEPSFFRGDLLIFGGVSGCILTCRAGKHSCVRGWWLSSKPWVIEACSKRKALLYRRAIFVKIPNRFGGTSKLFMTYAAKVGGVYVLN